MAVINSIEDTVWESCNVIVKVPRLRLIVYDATFKSKMAERRIELENSIEESRRRKEYLNKIPAWIEYVVTNLQVAKVKELQVDYETCQDIVPRGKTDPRVAILELSYHSYTMLEDLYTCSCKELVIHKPIPREVTLKTNVHQQRIVTKQSYSDLDIDTNFMDYGKENEMENDFEINKPAYERLQLIHILNVGSLWYPLADNWEVYDRGKPLIIFKKIENMDLEMPIYDMNGIY